MTHRAASSISAIAFGLAIACFAAYQQFKLPVALPVLLELYGYDRILAGGFMSVYAFVGIAVSVPFGRLIERLGTLAPLVVGMGLFIVGSAMTLAWPQSGLLVLLARGLEGLGFAVAAIVGPVMANAYASPRHLPIVIGLTAAWIPVGQLTATLVAPISLASVGWQGLWWLAIAGSVGCALWAAWLRRRDARLFARPFQARGPAKDSGRHGPGLTTKQVLLLAATGTIFMLWSAQYFAYMTWLPQYLVEDRGLAVSGALASYLIPVVLVLLSCIAAGLLLHRGVRLPRLLIGALIIQALSWWAVPFVQSTGAGIASLLVYGATAGLVPGCLFAMPSAALGSGARTAMAFGIVMTGRNIGVLAGPIVLAGAFEWTGDWSLASPIFGTATTLCLPVAFALAMVLRAPTGTPGAPPAVQRQAAPEDQGTKR
jgi:MFS family permease